MPGDMLALFGRQYTDLDLDLGTWNSGAQNKVCDDIKNNFIKMVSEFVKKCKNSITVSSNKPKFE